MDSNSLEDLRKVVALSELPDAQLQWILDHSTCQSYADGDIIVRYGEPAEKMWIALEGEVAFYMYLNGRQVYFYTFRNDNVTGGVGGMMPYSRMKTFPGYSYALGDTRLLHLHKSHFAELEQMNPALIQRLIGYMTERARVFATRQLQQEKINALGNLAASIAHEMNNPAAAIREIADELTRRLDLNYMLTRKLLECHLTPIQLQSIHNLVETKEHAPAERHPKPLLQRMEAQDAMMEVLEQCGVHEREIAETLTESGFTPDDLEQLCTDAGQEAFPRVMPWLENLVSSRKIIADLADASNRISLLVGAIKSHVHMDRTSDLQPTNIHQDIENTLTLLNFKLREKNIEVQRDFHPDLPDVPAYVGELNQVWMNLIDNAIFAMGKNGVLAIHTEMDERDIRVAITDNGPGIPPEIMPNIFDPFFTTKKAGDGTGLGLDIVHRIVKRHKGDIKVSSIPGRTEFVVSIPVDQ